MSCGTTLDDEKIWQSAKGHKKSDYFVFMMTGSNDFAYSYDRDRAKAMAASSYFSNVDKDKSGNMALRIKQGYSHNATASMEYTYNGLMALFKQAASYTAQSKITDVKKDSAFNGQGRLLFPADASYYSGDKLGNLKLTWYNNIKSKTTVEIVNTLKSNALNGQTIFYDIYSDEEKKEDPDKKDTGLFFFKGKKNAKTAIVNAGGGFAYVGAMQDSFPVALELSKKGYNAFALIYRPGEQTAYEDLSRAIAFLTDHASAIGIDMSDYSLWGGSAGARMAASVGTNGTARYGEKAYPKPAAVIMQYTSYETVTGQEPPTYACIGTADTITSVHVMREGIDKIKKNGTDAMIEVFTGLPHGFGLGRDTAAEGWVDHAVSFWQRNM